MFGIASSPFVKYLIMLKKPLAYDVIVIGAGPAGYACALRCAQLGLKTVCIDNWRDNNNQGRLGGAHLNTGGVASMTLLDSAKMYHQLKYEAKKHGARAALFGRKINTSEHQLTFVRHLRRGDSS